LTKIVTFFTLGICLLDPGHPLAVAQSQQPDEDSAQLQRAATRKSPKPFRLADGTAVRLSLIQNLSSANAAFGESVGFEVMENVKVNGVVVIPFRAMAWGTVTEVQRKGRRARGGRLTVKIDAVRLADGEVAPLRSIEKAKGEGHSGAMKSELEQTALTFFPAAPLALLLRGEDVTIPRGAEVAAYVNGDTTLDLQRFESEQWEEQDSQPSNEVTDLALLCIVQIRSTPGGAEIVIDKKYMGGTPSVIRLAPGDHKIQLNKAGFKTWERTVTLAPGGSEFLHPSLQAQ
jgi:PEGA domain